MSSFRAAPRRAPPPRNFFPPATLLLLLPKFWGWRLFISLSTLFSALTFYLYLKRHFHSQVARIGGAVTFATSGLMTTWLEIGTAVWAMATVPLVLYLLDGIILDGKQKYLPLLSLAYALLIFAGNVQITTYASIILVFYSIYQTRLSAKSLGSLLLLALFASLGVGLAAIQLLPTLDLFNFSIRDEESYSCQIQDKKTTHCPYLKNEQTTEPG